MRSMKTVLAVAVGIVVGCGSARYIAPPKLAEAQAHTVTRWEYYCVYPATIDKLDAEMKAAGAQGWELVGAGGMRGGDWCFKRPLAPQ